MLKGEATIVLFGDDEGPDEQDVITVAKHNAIGMQAIEGAVNDDNVLVLGGPEPEYNGCPNFLILNHFFDGAENPVTDDGSRIITLLTLVPCTQDFLRQIPGATVVQYLVYNEFEQRFSTSRSRSVQAAHPALEHRHDAERAVDLQRRRRRDTDRPDPDEPARPAAVRRRDRGAPSGGRLRVPPIADFNVHYQGDRIEPDIITLP